MSSTTLLALVARCRSLYRPRSSAADAELLARFVQQRDPAAFEELLERYAPLVWGVCRRIAVAEMDAEDAFQATFLALLRQADRLDSRQPLAGWLHTVASRVARKAQARLRRHQTLAEPSPTTTEDIADAVGKREMRLFVDEEIDRLPATLRMPLLLCCLQGQTRDEAAQSLGCSVAAIKGRLERGRELLRQRLHGRGVELPLAFLALTLTGERIRAALWAKTMQAALYTPTPAIVALAEAAVPAWMVGKGKAAALLILLVMGTAGAIGHTLTAKPQAISAPQPAKAVAEPKQPQPPQVRLDRHGDPLPEGAIARLGTVRWRLGYAGGGLVYSPDGKQIAAGGFSTAVTLWDAASGKLLHSFPNQSRPCSCGAFSPDGTMLAIPGMRVCHLWDIATGKEVRQLKAGREGLSDVAFAPDSKMVAGTDYNGTLHLWEAATGVQLRRIECKQDILDVVVFSPDGRRLATGGTDGTICLWDPRTGKECHRLKAHQRRVIRIFFSPDGKRLVSSSNDVIRVWDAATGRPLRDMGEKAAHSWLPIALSLDGTLLASGQTDGRIRLWDMDTGQEKRQWHVGAIDDTQGWGVSGLAFSPDGKTLASSSQAQSSIRVWDIATGRERHPTQEHHGTIDFLRYSPDGTMLVSMSSIEKRIVWWDSITQRPRRQFSWSAKDRSLAALSPDDNTLAVASYPPDQKLRLWDVRSGEPGLQMGNNEKQLTAIAFSPDGKLVASASPDHRVTLWDARDGKEVRQIKEMSSTASSLCFSPDGKALACATGRKEFALSEPTLRLWDVADGKERCSFQVHDLLDGLTFSPDGKILAGVAEFDRAGIVRLWDTRTGKELCRHTGHRDRVAAVAFSPDGKLVASGSRSFFGQDNSVHIWETASGRLIGRFQGHRSGVFSVAFAPNGLTVASGSEDSTVLIWDITGRRPDGRWHNNPLTPHQLNAIWTALANDDAAKAYDAVWTLAAAPEHAVPFLKKHLPPAPCPDAQAVSRWIAGLDSDTFTVRQKAQEELAKLGDAVTAPLQKALADKPTLEMRRRLQQLLAQSRDWTPERLRVHRAIQALEHINTRSARAVLQALAEGAPETQRTEEAKAALRRPAR